jgi:N-acetylneuraminate synthase
MHTTNLYPTPERLIRLNAMVELQEAFPEAVVGLSDHSLTNFPSLGAVALGACILERHFTDRMDRPGPDIICSMDPTALRELLTGSRLVHESLGGGKGPVAEESVTIEFARASVVAIRDIRAGENLTRENLWVKRPAGGAFGPADYKALLGRVCLEDVSAGRQLPGSAVARD